MICANTQALNSYLANQEQQEQQYEYMLGELRDAEPEDYENIIEYWEFQDADLQDIIKDI